MNRLSLWLHKKEWVLFNFINHSCHHKILNIFFGNITHIGGATFTISFSLFIILFTPTPYKIWGGESLIALTISHVLATMIKKKYQRKRPYITYPETNTPSQILKDYSFPSGHTTAVFSLLTPFMYHMPSFAVYFMLIASLVGLSRIYIGLHYPTDVLAGCLLGVSVGVSTVYFSSTFFII